jgi:hypothetical protein
MSWPVAFDERRITLHVAERIGEHDALRQEATARELLRRLATQPGIVLADEVGMGKTFVALAVAASVSWANHQRRPVVVMVPPSLQDKWPRDFTTFRSRCVLNDEDRQQLRAKSARSGMDFLRLLDDPVGERPSLIFLTHGALHRALDDPWVKLAIFKRALRSGRCVQQREALPRFAGKILRIHARGPDADCFEELLRYPISRWRDILVRYGQELDDDPVPKAVAEVLEGGTLDFAGLRECMLELPLRMSASIDDRLQEVRRSLNSEIKSLKHARIRLPLIILDEAHHLKNPQTRLVSLFVEPDASEDAKLLKGALNGAFERMLFLTATPFQLGHHELLNVLERFRDIRWPPGDATMSRAAYDEKREGLARILDASYAAAAQLDQRWARLTSDDVGAAEVNEESLEPWWQRVVADPEAQPERVQAVLRAYARARDAMRATDVALRPWVIRHLRAETLEGSTVPRRVLHRGAAIIDSHDQRGIAVRESALLPFLLAARSQAVLSRTNPKVRASDVRRATFAEGLASSYEAFLETRLVTLEEKEAENTVDEDTVLAPAADSESSNGTLAWYLDQMRKALPARAEYMKHPKIEPTIKRACDLWERGEKVLIFCHYRATSRALPLHISEVLGARIRAIAAAKLGCDPLKAMKHIERLGNRFEPGRPLSRSLNEAVDEIVRGFPDLTKDDVVRIQDIFRRFIRTPAFLARFFPLAAGDTNLAFQQALRERDSSGLSLHDKLTNFIEFLAKRCEPELREEYLKAVREIATGVRYGREDAKGLASGPSSIRLPSVRRATGDDDRDSRRRTLLGFNTPFFPEILVASSVMAEGVDLHLECRHVIHHDLCWNPSTLEQRTGRIDRIGAKAERAKESIQVYLPYVAETQDEKMYRVVRDRERWFHALMDETYVVNEAETEKMAQRIALPVSAAVELAFRLAVYQPGPPRSRP